MPKVMILEDDDTMLTLLQTLLGYEGFDVVAADQRLELPQAFGEVRRIQPDLLLLDVQLRKYTGIDLLRKLRQEEPARGPRVLVTSGRDLSHECYQEGADGFLLKPYMPDELITRINKILGN